VRRGVSFHGLALNVNLDLKPFCWIQPCGLEGVGVTSIEAEAGSAVDIADVKRVMKTHIEAVFQTGLEALDRQNLLLFPVPSPDEEAQRGRGNPTLASCRESVQG